VFENLALADARTVIAAAEKRAEEISQPQNIAVVDEGGNLISHVRMDGAWLGSVDISINKAWTRGRSISRRKISPTTVSPADPSSASTPATVVG
jgi:uncharacterized protein GlcG (DUF336 family)